MGKRKIPDAVSSENLELLARLHKLFPDLSLLEIKNLQLIYSAIGSDHALWDWFIDSVKQFNEHQWIRSQYISGLKGAFKRSKTKRSKPTEYELIGQIGLFHPEAYKE